MSVLSAPDCEERPTPAESNNDFEARATTSSNTPPPPIAVVGMSCRLPGAANVDQFWELIRDGRDAIREVPSARWNVADFLDADPDAPGKMITKWGGFLDDLELFDPFFFGISAREADRMDPQQRLLLELAWEAFENAGCAPARFAGSRTGVFVGIASVDYSQRMLKDGAARKLIDAYVGIANAHSIAANRLSYFFDLHGPSLAVDTACSSSLVGLHLACQSIWRGEASAALVGGVNAILSPEVSVSFSHARMLTPDRQCRPFDANANGYIRGEGGAVVLLRKLSDALADGDTVLAVIRGTAVNQDGRTPGITAPSAAAQRAAIRDALAVAGIPARQLGYIEAHGTGTPLGDGVEVSALSELFGSDAACHFGSVKANVGHLEAASGIVGLIKVILCLRQGLIPPQINLEVVHPKLALAATKLSIPRTLLPWTPAPDAKRIAGVNSFGFGGTNAHVIVEEAPTPAEASDVSGLRDRSHQVLCLSAKTSSALNELIGRYIVHLEEQPAAELVDVCHTANVGRSHFLYRLSAVAGSSSSLRALLQRSGEGSVRGVHRSSGDTTGDEKKIAFLFSGQGAQYAAMGRQLAESSAVFRSALARCAALFDPHLERPLLEVFFDETSRELERTIYAQTCLFTLQYALYCVWTELGVKPSVVMGHSVGEYAAAVAAGVFDLDVAAQLLVLRARLMESSPPGGQMLVVYAGDDVVSRLLEKESSLSIAAYNGPENIVISGDSAAVERASRELEAARVRTQRLNTSHAFHSALMDPILQPMRRGAQGLQFSAPRVPLVSNLTGKLLRSDEAPNADYWVSHVRQPVRFREGMATLAEQRVDTLLEIGPTPTLLALGKRCWKGGPATWLPSLTKSVADWECLLMSAGALYASGVDLEWEALDRGQRRRKLALPNYPYDRRHHWINPSETAVSHERTAATEPLLGARIPSALSFGQYECVLDLQTLGFLRDHQVEGAVLLPAAAFIDLALAGAADFFGAGSHELSNLMFQQALFLSEKSPRRVQLIVYPASAGESAFAIASAPLADSATAAWTHHATGKILVQRTRAESSRDQTQQTQAADLVNQLGSEEFYALLAANGLNYGPAFRGVSLVRFGPSGACGDIEAPPSVAHEVEQYAVHPSLLDSCFQVLAAAAIGQGLVRDGGAFIPIAADRVWFKRAPLGNWRSHARIAESPDGDPDSLIGHVVVTDDNGHTLGEVSGLRLRRISRNREASDTNLGQHTFEVAWHALEGPSFALPGPTARSGEWIVIGHGDFPERMRDELDRAGERSHCTDPDASALSRLLAEPNARPLRLVLCADCLVDEALEVDSRAMEVARSALELLQVAVRHYRKGLRVWVVTRGAEALGRAAGPIAPDQGTAAGLVKTVALEHPELELRSVDLDLVGDARQQVTQLRRWLVAESPEDRVAFRGEQIWAPRLTALEPDPPTSDEDSARVPVPAAPVFYLSTTKAGSLDNLRWRAARRVPPEGSQVEVEVRAAGLNFRDLMNAMGMYPGGPIPFGGECAGVVSAIGPEVTGLSVGDHVLGIAHQAFASHAVTLAPLLVKKPASIGFVEAATIPIACLTAHYALNRLGHLQRGERVLIHAAAGGVGLAAVQLALQAGAEVFATTGTAEKRSFLEFIGVQHVLDSRTLKFADDVMRATGGKGVDLALNSLPGEFIPTTLATLAPYGRFLEIGRTDIYLNKQLGLFPFRNNLSYHAIDLGQLCADRPDLVQVLLAEIAAMLSASSLKPLPRRVFRPEEVIDGFRFMAQRRNTGKVVFAFAERPEPAAEFGLRADASYLITGGLGGLGLVMARALVERGARNLVLWSRQAPEPSVFETVRALNQLGARVEIVTADVADRVAVERVFDGLRSMPPLRGLIHAAGVLADGLVIHQTAEQVERVLLPKVRGAWNLHLATKDMPLDFFVLFSSIASVTGSPGQSNYAAANAFLDALAHHRRRDNLPALSINWGPWASVGMAARTRALSSSRLVPFDPLSPEAGAERFFSLLARDVGQAVVAPIRLKVLRELHKRPSTLLTNVLGDHTPAARGGSGEGFGRAALVALDPAARRRYLIQYLQTQLGRVLGIDKDALHPKQALNQIGMDSLMALELKEKLEVALDIVIPISALVVDATLFDLADKVLELVDDSAPTGAEHANGDLAPVYELDASAAASLLDRVDELSPGEIDALLGAESATGTEP